MASTSSIYVLLKFYATRQNSAVIDNAEFFKYIKVYAQRHVEEQPELIPFLGDSDAVIQKELDELVKKRLIIISAGSGTKLNITVIAFYVRRIAERYKEIENNVSIPFPVPSDLPKNTVSEVMQKHAAEDMLEQLLKKEDINDKILYALILPHDIPPILFPSSVSVQTLFNISMTKIRTMLKKEEYHDYFLKKVRISNPGKEIAAKNFFSQFVQNPSGAIEDLKKSGDKFYFFTQLCFFIKKDFEKVKDLTQEDIGLLQAISVSEIMMGYYKNQSQLNFQREAALESLKQNLQKPPYYYSMNTISKFTDSHGIPLYGQYTEEDLKNFLQKETSGNTSKELPDLLVFKINSGKRYFIYKQKILPLIIRLCNDAHDTVKDRITQHWYGALKNFEKLPEMHEQPAFEKRLESEVNRVSPILFSLLHSNFLILIQYEALNMEQTVPINLFDNGKLLPYSELLMIDRRECLSNAKMMLPFWYGIPIISWIISVFTRKPGKKESKATKRNEMHISEQKQLYENEILKKNTGKQLSKKEALSKAAEKLESELVPSESNLKRELDSYRKQWNKMITREANHDLTEDVNMLIRDYLRKVIKTLNAVNFTMPRIDNLADTLVRTPNMKKIKAAESLRMYVKLYILFLIRNMK
ncbi:MAG: hypothetical protein LKF96_10700 [Treponema sp.]|jgi:acetone carboxylase gamma subunit|nr:hypothetical protein [Treponema sp.]